MPPTRASTECWLLNNVSSILDETWIRGFENVEGKENPSPLPFTGKPKLPSKEQTLKLMMFYKKSSRFKSTSTGDIANLVLDQLYRYWKIANIPVMVHFRAKKKVVDLFNDYQSLLKLKNRDTDKEKAKRAEFQTDLTKLFDLAAVDAEDKIRKDRLLQNDAKCEDILFLEDQRRPRVGWIDATKVDLEYSKSVKVKSDKVARDKRLEAEEQDRVRETLRATTSKEIIEDESEDIDYQKEDKR